MSLTLEEMPIVIWPKWKGEYKFVQLEVDSKPFLRFENDKARIHASILRYFFRELGISPNSVEGLSGISCPSLKGERYSVFGMGKADIDLIEKIASFYGISRDYGMGVNREFFERHKLLIPDLTLVY